MGNWLRRLLCCDERDEDAEDERPALCISGPTNFRREDITIPGLDPEQQRFIREKAIADARKMYANLQPLASSPSGHFASPTAQIPTITTNMDHTNRASHTDAANGVTATTTPTTATPTMPNILPSFETFTTPRPLSPSPPPSVGNRLSDSLSESWDRMKRHSRKISNSLAKPLGYQAVEQESHDDERARESEREMQRQAEAESRYEMQALIVPPELSTGAAKDSRESFSLYGSEIDENGVKKI